MEEKKPNCIYILFHKKITIDTIKFVHGVILFLDTKCMYYTFW